MPGVLDGTKGRGGWKLVSLVSFLTLIRKNGKWVGGGGVEGEG